jgi:hypothetical protein
MAGNSDPLFSKAGKIGAVAVTAANTSSQGGGTIGTNIFLAFTADATNGSFVREVRFMPAATAAGTATTATVARVFISSVTSGATTSSNTHLFADIALGSQTADSTTSGTFPVIVLMNIALPPNYTILVTNHAAPAANTHWKCTVVGGDY